MASRPILLSGGWILSMDPAIGDLRTGDILIEGDRIRAVAALIDAGEAERIDALCKAGLSLPDTRAVLQTEDADGSSEALAVGVGSLVYTSIAMGFSTMVLNVRRNCAPMAPSMAR
jgi:hypothetical protein